MAEQTGARCGADAASDDDARATAARHLALARECGAVVVAPQHTAAVGEALEACGLRRRGKNTTTLDDGRRCVHATAAGAATLRAAAARGWDGLPAPLAAALRGARAEYAAGLRVGSARCGGPRGAQCTSALHAKRFAPRGTWPQPAATFTFSELFAGVGGFGVALRALGGRCVFASEVDVQACGTYAANFGEVPSGDITEIDERDVPPHDVLTAGFPCQRFSRCGDGGGFAVDALFFHVVRVLVAARPRGFLLENVAEFAAHDGGFTRRVAVAALEAAGYATTWRVVDALALLPQHRDRCYLVGVRRDAGAGAYAWPPLPRVRGRCAAAGAFGRRCPCRRVDGGVGPVALRHVLEADPPADCALSANQWANVARRGDGAADVAARRLCWPDGAARTLMANYKRGYAMYSEFVPSNDGPPRFYTRREAARLMGFPDAFSVDHGHGGPGGRGGGGNADANVVYAQLGNAVCPPVVCAIAAPLLRAVLGPGPAWPDGALAPAVFDLLRAAGQALGAAPAPCAPRPVGF